MSRDERERNERLGRTVESYNPPPPPPREEMWARIEARLEPRQPGVVDLRAERGRRAWSGPAPYAWAAAAAAVLVLGIGIGRMSVPAPTTERAEVGQPEPSALAYATAEHFERTEILLRMIRSDAAAGLDPVTADWAGGLLLETRLLLDTGAAGQDPAIHELLEDLELVLVQIVGAAGAGADRERARSELRLALGGLERRELLSRIEAVTLAGA